ncbi:PPE family protein [Mycobacterium spongiae]|uniref:PPE domain-containing protein n=1 Tax=Mycobacterium spongiae TaxID=886343 RepID=A0A975JV54_9MYCO|nr:PPE family protein [Mycobacterium spongiae]QUR65704.1 PPE domain-containing protein [Mycobacterium spongiae]
MDFGVLPPEINSGRMYCGPGSAPMVAAASGWNGLAAELNTTAAGYERVVTELHSEQWTGGASTLMVDAVAPYVAWMKVTAAQAELASSQARAAVAAYEAAIAATVPPPLIAANRAELALLNAQNLFGQYTGAIAALEAQYEQMWVQDAVAMYTYAGSSATAAAVTPFAAPPPITSLSPAAGQSVAAAVAATTSAGTSQRALLGLISQLPAKLAQLASPSSMAAAAAAPPASARLLFVARLPWPLTSLAYNTVGLPYFGIGMGNSMITSSEALGLVGPEAAAVAEAAPPAAAEAAEAALGTAPVTAGLANATSIGKLSVPPTWTEIASESLAPTAGSASVPLASAIVDQPESAGAGHVLGGLPAASSSGSGAGPRYGIRPTVMARPPFAG